MLRPVPIIVYAALTFFGIGGAVAYAQSPVNTGTGDIDCTDVKVDYADDPSLTLDEKLALMDRALLESLSKYDACQIARGKGGAEGDGSGESGDANATGSVAASDMSGTETPTQQASTSGSSSDANKTPSPPPVTDNGVWSNPDAPPEDPKADGADKPSQQAYKNGKIPEDIPPADNDSVLERQIRQAAINETDPVLRAKLWNEYRKYKGLPPVE